MRDNERRGGDGKVTGRGVRNVRVRSRVMEALGGDRECDITSHLVRGSCLDWSETPPVPPAHGSLINHCV